MSSSLISMVTLSSISPGVIDSTSDSASVAAVSFSNSMVPRWSCGSFAKCSLTEVAGASSQPGSTSSSKMEGSHLRSDCSHVSGRLPHSSSRTGRISMYGNPFRNFSGNLYPSGDCRYGCVPVTDFGRSNTLQPLATIWTMDRTVLESGIDAL